MQLELKQPLETLNSTYRRANLGLVQATTFKNNLSKLLEGINEQETEENQKNIVIEFLKNIYYKDLNEINTKGRQDLVIHNDKTAKSSVGVIIEVKRTSNKAEMISAENPNTKALQELLHYYLKERFIHNNKEIKHLIITNIYEWYVFDGADFERFFFENKQLKEDYKNWTEGKLGISTTDWFYKEIAKPFLEDKTLECTHFDIRKLKHIVTSEDLDVTANNELLLDIYKIFSPEHLLKKSFLNDANTLNTEFYNELLHILGVEETGTNKKIITRIAPNDRHKGSLLENTITNLIQSDEYDNYVGIKQFGETKDEQIFSFALELCIAWLNRILFLKLLEGQLLKYHKKDPKIKFLKISKIKDFKELDTLFFRVLAIPVAEREKYIIDKFGDIPYLNSALFDTTDVESVLKIKDLDSFTTLPIFNATVLKDDNGKRITGASDTLKYLFEFLDAFDFASDANLQIQKDNKTIINAAVLGLIFEKINGYKDGSVFTPSFITMYMCRESIRRAVIQKFNEEYNWNCADFTDLYNQIDKISKKQANETFNKLRICDPAVGSGHFLVSAMNEMIVIKHELRILIDATGRRLLDYSISTKEDELVITRDDEVDFEYNFNNPESQRIQETLFHEKQNIIETCLFGVDVNSKSVLICRLRLWIELLKNTYYTQESNFKELETLPNIDINIKTGNSLLSRFDLDADLSKAFTTSKWNISSYKLAVQSYHHAKGKQAKKELLGLINDIKGNFETTFANNDPLRAKLSKLRGQINLLESKNELGNLFEKLIDIDITQDLHKLMQDLHKLEEEAEEIKKNTFFHNSFEWRFEFPEVLNDNGDFVGFDLVIGNPPYVDYREIGSRQVAFMKNFQTTFKSPRPNLYQYFIEKGYHILREKGRLCYINPNQFLSIDAGFGIRKFLVENTIIEFIDDVSNIKVFGDVATYTVVWSFRKEKNGNYPVRISKCKDSADLGKSSLIVRKNDIIANGKYLIIANVNQILIQKIEKDATKLDNLCKMCWGTSQSGYGKKKILENEFLLLSMQEQGKYAPILQTRDIKRLFINWKKEYIPKEIFSDNAISKFEVDSKILIARMTLSLQAGIDTQKRYVGKSTIMYDLDKNTNEKYLLALLNSKLIDFWYKNYFENTHLAGGYIRFDIPYLKKIPIKQISQKAQKPFINLVDAIISQKAAGLDSLENERKIDALVYDLYEITAEEQKIIEGK